MYIPAPHFTVTITASVVAWYAAIVSTLSSAIQVANHLRDRVRVRVTLKKNMETMNDPVHHGMKLTLVKTVNTGRRPVYITNVGMVYLDDRGAIFNDNTPRLPCELTEGKYVQTFFDQSKLNFDEVRYFVAYDAVGREFRTHFASRHRRVYWWFRRRLKRKADASRPLPTERAK
jgi:hypothetical protein